MDGHNTYTPEVLTGLNREQLRRMLTDELKKEPSCMDADFVRLLLAELRARGSDPAYADDEAVEAACEKFRRDTEMAQKPRKRWYQSWMLRAATIILALGVLFFSLPDAQAGNVKDVLSWWSDSVFQFFEPGRQPNVQEFTYKTDHPGLQKIYDTVVAEGITEQVVPTELDLEFELTELKVGKMFEETSIHARLADGKNRIVFTITAHSEQPLLQHENDTETVPVWELAGVEHHAIANVEGLIVTWVADNIECTIATDCPEENVYDLIKSIYISEG